MKRLAAFALIFALGLSGCRRSPVVPGPNSPAVDKQAGPANPPTFTPETHKPVPLAEVPLLEQINRENILVASAVMPAVVRVLAVHPAGNRFASDFLFHFGTNNSRHSSESAYGSGVLISRDGYIVTNNHVIADAGEITVELQDKRSFSAHLVGIDTLVDLAVLKIDGHDLSALPWGNSEKVEVGEQVFAIGNPFNLDDSVSKGIVSATGRSLPNFSDYIQTDAAINPGNSGGALVNIRGELIGLNTAIASVSRFSMGVGFAIPSNLVRYAAERLITGRKSAVGYLGVVPPDTIDDGVLGQLGLKTDRGALIAFVQPGSPAAQANLRSSDFITSIEGHRVSSFAELHLLIWQLPVGKEVPVNFIREGKPRSTHVVIGEAPGGVSDTTLPGGDSEGAAPVDKPVPAQGMVLGGIQVADLDGKARKKFRIDAQIAEGAVVTSLQEGCLAEFKGMQAGDVIEQVFIETTTCEVHAAKDFGNIAANLKPEQSAALLVRRGRVSSFLYFSPEK